MIWLTKKDWPEDLAIIAGIAIAVWAFYYVIMRFEFADMFRSWYSAIPFFAWRLLKLLVLIGIVVGAAALHPALGVVVFLSLLVNTILSFFRRRWLEQQILLRTIALALDHRLSLSEALRNAAWAQSRWTRDQTLAMAERLDQGWPLGRAAEQRPTPLPAFAIEALRAGQATGDYGPLLTQAMEARFRLQPIFNLLVIRFGWLAINAMVLLAFYLIAFPQVVRIWQSYGTPLSFVALMASRLRHTSMVILFATVGLGFAAILYFSLRMLGIRVPWSGRGTLSKKLRQCRVISYLASAVEHQVPLPELFKSLAEPTFRKDVWKPFQCAAAAMERGESWQTALAAAKLIPPADMPILMSADRAGNLPQVCHKLATMRQQTLLFRTNVWGQVISQMLLVLASAALLLLAMSVFEPMCNLVTHLAK